MKPLNGPSPYYNFRDCEGDARTHGEEIHGLSTGLEPGQS